MFLFFLLVGQDASGFDDDFAQLVDITFGQRLALGAGQTQFALGRVEGHIDGLVRDASLIGHVFQTTKKKKKKKYLILILGIH